jgi:hypothetical protein
MEAAKIAMTETNLGYFFENSEITLLFGGIKANLVNLQASFPDFEFVRVKQTHGNIITETKDARTDYQIEADAHVTESRRTALCIATADCVPLFVFDVVSKKIAGVHAGWRGVANQIIPKTIQHMISSGSKVTDLQIYIGPHIQKNSFEVQNDVRDQLLSTLALSAITAPEAMVSQLTTEKCLVDLSQIVHAQLQNVGIVQAQVFDLHLDTFVDLRFHSYRREQARAGRQLSFICLK